MTFELILLGPKGEQQFARMGFRPYKWAKDIAAWTLKVQERTCIADGCNNQAQTGMSHGWTCVEHSPERQKR